MNTSTALYAERNSDSASCFFLLTIIMRTFFSMLGGCCTFTGVDVHGDWLAGGWTSSL